MGAFATSSRLKLCELAVFCKRLTGLRKLNMMILALSFGVAAILSTILVVSGAVENVNLLWMLVYQALLIAVYFLTARGYLPFSFDKMMRNEVERKAEPAKDSNDEKNNTEKISKEADQDEQD